MTYTKKQKTLAIEHYSPVLSMCYQEKARVIEARKSDPDNWVLVQRYWALQEKIVEIENLFSVLEIEH